jgi:hypothetical protein
MFFLGSQYLRSIPTAGNDRRAHGDRARARRRGGFATHVRSGDGVALARVGWIAGGLLVLGIGARMAFAFAVGHGLEATVRTFSIDHRIAAAAWPAALVLMALTEAGARLSIVQARATFSSPRDGYRLAEAAGTTTGGNDGPSHRLGAVPPGRSAVEGKGPRAHRPLVGARNSGRVRQVGPPSPFESSSPR